MYATNQVRVDDAHPFLLSSACEKRAKDLESVDIHEVFIKISPAHIVLRAHLIPAAHPGKGFDHALDTAFGASSKPDVLALHGSAFFTGTLAFHLHFIEEGGVHDLCLGTGSDQQNCSECSEALEHGLALEALKELGPSEGVR